MSKINKQDLLEIKYTLKIYIRIIFYIDNLFLIKNRSLTSSEGENVSDALIQHGLFRRAYDQINSYSFTQFMLQNMFTKICSESHTGKCDEYDELSKLFKNIGLNTNDIKTIKTKLFKVLDEINARITQSERVKAMKAKIKKLIEELNKQQDVETILNKIKELLGEKRTDGQPLMEDQKLQALINDIFTNIESGQDEGGLNRLGAGRGKERDPTDPKTGEISTQTNPETGEIPTQTNPKTGEIPTQTQDMATQPPVNDTTDANLIAASLIANMDKQPQGEPPKPEPPPEPPAEAPVNDTTDANLIAAALIANMDDQPPPAPPAEPPPAPPPVNDTTDANLIAAALIANMDNQPQGEQPPPEPPPVNDTTDANLIAAALIANMDNQPQEPPAPAPAPAPEPEAEAAEKEAEAKAEIIKDGYILPKLDEKLKEKEKMQNQAKMNINSLIAYIATQATTEEKKRESDYQTTIHEQFKKVPLNILIQVFNEFDNIILPKANSNETEVWLKKKLKDAIIFDIILNVLIKYYKDTKVNSSIENIYEEFITTITTSRINKTVIDKIEKSSDKSIINKIKNILTRNEATTDEKKAAFMKAIDDIENKNLTIGTQNPKGGVNTLKNTKKLRKSKTRSNKTRKRNTKLKN